MESKAVSPLEIALKLGLTEAEYGKVVQILDRTPNFTETAIFSVMWSEHCSYKNSIKWLKTLPRDSPEMMAKAGEENAGMVDIGDGLACVFKIESHNHPSAIEPYQGAATGVGGINRDIFTMGARPIAQLNSLRFGNPSLPHTQWLLKGIVKGIGDYGNAFGIPTVGGEVFFDDSYSINPLVNAMSAGIVKKDETVSATSYGAGNPVYIVGSYTGKDGIHGAAFASKNITENSSKELPSVQVGDPFQEKLLLEATLEVIKTGAVVGMQDMGAAGIICSNSEMSAKGKHGMRVDLDKVPLRNADMQPFEILLSESQERMLVVVKKGMEKTVETVFQKWDLLCAIIGEVTEGGRLEYYMKGEKVADVPAFDLVLGGGAPVYDREYSEPAYFSLNKQFDIHAIPQPSDLKAVAWFLAARPNLLSKKWISRQYDSTVGTVNMTTNRPSDASVVNLKGTDRALAFTVDCNARYVQADPEAGTAIAVAEAARNLTCAGATPMAITNCLNFGNPYDPEVYWQFVHAIKGMSTACVAFNTPVTGGNVSFYNHSTDGGPVLPTPVIGMLGLLDHKDSFTTLKFAHVGDPLFIIGHLKNDLSSSEYLYGWHRVKNTPAPYFDVDEEKKLHKAVRQLIARHVIVSAHDVSDGGLFFCLLESAMAGGVGFNLEFDQAGIRKDAFLFGEAQGRVVVSTRPENRELFEEMLKEFGVPVHSIGTVTEEKITVNHEFFGIVQDFSRLHEHKLEQILSATEEIFTP